MKYAIEYARSRQSSLSTMIHLSHHNPNSWETIPIFENLCFVAALFRSHVMANTLEGRELLKKILAFQIISGEHSGLFPRYVHEYPCVEQKGYLISIIIALYFLQRHHSQLLHSELQQTLMQAIDRLLDALDQQTWIDSISILLRVIRGEMPDRESLLTLRQSSIRECIYLLHIVQILFLQQHPSAAKMFHYLSSYWSKEMNSYIGPLGKERYTHGEEPVSLFHYFMHNIADTKLSMPPSLTHLYAALLYPIDTMPPFEQKLPLVHENWKIQYEEKFLWQICTQLPQQVCKGFHLFRILWIDEIVHSMVCQQLLPMTYRKIDEGESELLCRGIPEHGLELYFRKTKNTKIYSNGKRATCFIAGEWITIDTGNAKLCLHFTCPEEAPTMATLSMHHRPAELQPDILNVDWRLSIRVLSLDNKRHSLRLRVQREMGYRRQVPLYVDHCPHTE